MKITLEKITPKMAAKYLERNTRNRNLRPGYVGRLARSMRDGQWKTNNDAIVFSRAGDVLNGQHRLHAVVESGLTTEFMVMRNADPSMMAVIDTGPSRTVADYIKISMGLADACILSAAASCLWRYKQGYAIRGAQGSEQNCTPQDVEETIKAHPRLGESIAQGRAINRVLRSMGISPSVCTFFCYAIKCADKDRAEDFIQQLADGEGLRKGDPAFALRNNAITRTKAQTAHLKPTMGISMLVKAWNKYFNGERVQHISITEKDGFPVIAGCAFSPKLEECPA